MTSPTGDVAGTIFHSDRGAEHTADLFEQACETLGIARSMGRVGSCADNTAAEALFSTLEWELFRKRHFDTNDAARREVARFIDWYSLTRRHSSCEMKPRIEFEAILAGRVAETVLAEEEGGVKTGSRIASQPRNGIEWHRTPGQ